MSNSQHPRALSLENWVSDSTRLLAVVMALPLIDGVFVAVVLGGALDSVFGILEVGLLVFGGSAMAAVILAEMDETPRQQVKMVLAVGAVVIAGAALQAALAPTLESFLNMEVFERFAALVILAVAASTASAKVGEYLPGPMLVITLGLIATVSPSEASLVVATDVELVVRAVAAASVGVAFGLFLAVTSPWLRETVELDRFRFGSAVALGVLAISIVGLIPSDAPVALVVLAVTALLAFDPGVSEKKSPGSDGSLGTGIPDGGDAVATEETTSTREDSEGDEQSTRDDAGGIGPDEDRPPWL